MEIESNKLKVIIITVLLIGGFYVYYSSNSINKIINHLNVIINDEYNGVVIDKYRDFSEHNKPIIKLSNDRTVYLSSEEFSKVDKFDSISKSKKSNLLYIFKKDTIIKIDITLGIKERIKEKEKEKETNH